MLLSEKMMRINICQNLTDQLYDDDNNEDDVDDDDVNDDVGNGVKLTSSSSPCYCSDDGRSEVCCGLFVGEFAVRLGG
jgi:hypothetical protein